ncbi:MAG: ABC transporter substrate-binding protein [Actinomycetota bacterium]|nr:ABC transporter substrate-binding protein [Actinomycetota bacterium]
MIAACSDDETSSTTTAASQTTTDATDTTDATETTTGDTAAPDTTVAAKSPILIAATMDLTGVTGRGEAGKVVEAWAEFVNAKGGINGHPVELDIRDTTGDPAVAASATADLLAEDPVLFLLESSSTEASQAEALAASGVPVMGVGYSPAVWGGHIEAFKLDCGPEAPIPCAPANVFPIVTTFGAVVDEQVLGAQAAGATVLAVAACAEVEACSQAGPVFDATAAAVGLVSKGSVKVSSTATDYSAECIQWINDGVDFIQISGGVSLAEGLYNSCTDQGYTGIWGASAGSVSGKIITIEGITLAGGLNAFPWFVDDPLVQEYRDTLTAAGISDDGINDPTATGLWSVLQLFAKANASLVDEPTAADTLANMYTIEDETLGGLIAPTTFYEDQPGPEKARNCFWPYILKDGEMTNPLGGLTIQCYPEV